ncbi:MAG: metallophosphoesterase [Clostridium sp.]|jgi:putative phosphoesterase|nr:metallophosphoesterase [Clostridium sp.]
MKILVVSDTHRKNETLLSVIEKQKPLDMVIHCGDGEGCEYILSRVLECPVHIVIGNNDFFSTLPHEVEFMLGKYKIWVTHGHSYGISMGNERLKEEAKSRGANIVFCGHTHKPGIDRSDRHVTTVNPGSLSYPRQENRKPSYVIVEIDQREEIHFTIAYV